MVCPPTLPQAGMGGGLLHVIRTPKECAALLGVTHGVCIGCLCQMQEMACLGPGREGGDGYMGS